MILLSHEHTYWKIRMDVSRPLEFVLTSGGNWVDGQFVLRNDAECLVLFAYR